MWQQVLLDYLITFGWAIVGSVSMGLGIIVALRMFDWSTPNVDEWELIKQGNVSIAILLSAVVIALGMVISAAINPKGPQGQIKIDTAGVTGTAEFGNAFGGATEQSKE
jgi:hypothetical protein